MRGSSRNRMRAHRIRLVLKNTVDSYGAPVLFVWCCLLVWQLCSSYLSIPRYILPSPLDIVAAFFSMPTLFIKHTVVTLAEITIGFIFGMILGTMLAVLIFSWQFLYKTVYPVLVALQSIPKLALAPLLIIWFGFGYLPKIVLSALLTLFPVMINTLEGLGSAPPESIDLVTSLRAEPWQILWKIRFPASLPFLFTGLKIAGPLAVVGAVIGEFIGANKGIGYLIMLSSVNLDTDRMFVALIILAMIGSGLFCLICFLERVFLPWHINTPRTK